MYRVVVLISGSGSNLQAMIDRQEDGGYSICAVIANEPDAYGLQRARTAGIATHCIEHRKKERHAFDAELLQQVQGYEPDLVVLAGFMRILTSGFIAPLSGRLINIHPSLLPKYPGLNTHRRVLKNGDSQHGASVHFVTDELDAGPVIAQRTIAVLPTDTTSTLKERLLTEEHLLYPQVVEWFAQGRMTMNSGCACMDGMPLPPRGVQV